MLNTYTPIVKQMQPVLWINPRNSNSSSAYLAYQAISGLTASGTSGTNTLTMSSSVTTALFVGQEIRLNSVDVYTIASISTTTVTTTTNLTSTYSSVSVENVLISQLNSSDGISGNASQAVVGNQLTYVASSPMNSTPSLGGNNSNRALVLPAANAPINIFATGGTALAVTRPRSSGGAGIGRIVDKNVWLLTTSGASAHPRLIRSKTTNMDCSWTGPGLNATRIFIVQFDDRAPTTVPTAYVNSKTAATPLTTNIGTGTPVNDSSSPMAIGNNNASAGFIRAFDGFIGDIVLWNRILSQTEINILMDYYAKIYGVTLV